MVDGVLRSENFSDLEELGQAYKLESRNPRITISQPFQIAKCVVKTLNDSLISVNFSAPMADGCFVVYHFFGHTSHELTARINLEQLMQSQKAALLNRLKNLHNFSAVFAAQRLSFSAVAGDIDNGESVL